MKASRPSEREKKEFDKIIVVFVTTVRIFRISREQHRMQATETS